MRKEIAEKLNEGVLKYIEVYPRMWSHEDAELASYCSKCGSRNTYESKTLDNRLTFEEFFTDLILWAVSHECKE